MLYGELRLTHDIDLIVVLSPADIMKMSKIFPAPEYSEWMKIEVREFFSGK